MGENKSFTTESLTKVSCYFLPDPEFDQIPHRSASNLITSIINATFSPVAVVFNVVIIIIICKDSRLRNPSTLLLMSLALSDVLVGLLAQPSYVVFRLLENHKKYVPCFVRMIYWNVFYVCYGVSFMTLNAISFERYAALSLHLRYKELVTFARVLRVSITIWAVDIALTVLRWIERGSAIQGVHLSLWFLCLLASGAIYFRIGKIVRRHYKDIAKHERIPARSYRRQIKLAVNIAYIVGIYFIFNMPVLLVTTYHQIAHGRLNTYDYYNWAETVAFVNASVNPMVFCWRNRAIRKALTKLLGLENSIKLRPNAAASS